MSDQATVAAQRLGVWEKFPSVRVYLRRYAQGNPIDHDVAKLQRYGHEGRFMSRLRHTSEPCDEPYDVLSARTSLIFVSTHHHRCAVHAALRGQLDWQVDWQRAAAYLYWGLRAESAIQSKMLDDYEHGRRRQYPSMMSLQHTGGSVGDLLALGWLKWAVELARRAREGIKHNGFFDGGDDFGLRRTQHFVVRLVGGWQGWPELPNPRCAFDEPIFNALVEHWRSSDLAFVERLLLAACDRHTHQARIDRASRQMWFDLASGERDFDPFEVLAVMRLREQAGLANPTLDHPLMNTPLGKLPEVTPPHDDELLAAVVPRMRAELGGYWGASDMRG